ncbi:class Ib ribonucleoside-diphosphate reductase assembly flavoprotein NrdI [Neomicrococcus aestuarii]|uniref:class Ib ribonucleoside-diphosphate reductase assembly flavoprotein NrdI n=1 Tax=Neomicrococcus aestuarii TaxID=556325 RepID=UPI000A01DEB6|nr:class Ib ribonucleoside-diphosphate reductase assembly flavoprotein NrdI [Neomicrococcus aestuarii]
MSLQLQAPSHNELNLLTPSERLTTSRLVYFSSISENTKRFVDKLGHDAARIPLYPSESPLVTTAPFVLLLPTYGGEDGKHSIPPQVMKFLNDARNRENIRGVIGAGNTNFGTAYCLAARKIAAKLGIPELYRFELMGTPDDVRRVDEGLEEFWKHQ